MLKILSILMLLPSLSFANIDYQNFYKENQYDLKSIAYCRGFLQGINDIFDFLMDNYEDQNEYKLSENDKKEIEDFLITLTKFTNITIDELDFQMGMKCGEEVECRYQYVQKTLEGFNQGFDNIFMLYETENGKFTKEAEDYLDKSDLLVEMCFKL